MPTFRVEGRFKMGREWTKFATDVEAADEAGARERTLSTLGSRHRVDRRHVELSAVRPAGG